MSLHHNRKEAALVFSKENNADEKDPETAVSAVYQPFSQYPGADMSMWSATWFEPLPQPAHLNFIGMGTNLSV